MMDPEVSVLLHCAAWRGLLESRVQVELSERYNRQTDDTVERHIEEVWRERVSKEPWLFNGAKFRLHSFCFTTFKSTSSSNCTAPKHLPCTHSCEVHRVEHQEDKLRNRQRREGLCDAEDRCRGSGDAARNSLDRRQGTENVIHQNVDTLDHASSDSSKNTDDPESRPLLTLRLGLTCYKDYLGNNWSCGVAGLRQRGEAEFNDPMVMLSQPLGVGAILCTNDGQVVMIRRSQRVAEAGGLLDIPGGHPEPKAVCEGLGQAGCEEVSMVMMQRRPEAVVAELFASVCAEIRDEVNVPLSCLGQPVLMGVALNHTSAERPSAEFYVSCSLSSEDVRQLYWKGGAEAHESTDIIFLSRTDVLQLDRSRPLWSELCPSAKGAVMLYQTVKPDED